MDYSKFVGYFELNQSSMQQFESNQSVDCSSIAVGNHSALKIKTLLSDIEVDTLISEMNNNKQIPVGVDGMVANYKEGSNPHSYRSTIYNKELAEIIYHRVKDLLPVMQSVYDNNNDLYKPVGVNPSFRFIDYEKGGFLIPHYDFPYREHDNKLTLLSFVIYLTQSHNDGSTRFVKEYRINQDTDWVRQAAEHEIIETIYPEKGAALIFPHHLLHEGITSVENKIIIRTDVMFERITK